MSVSGGPLPLARKLRTLLFLDHNVTDSINSLAVMTWGQFLGHDVSLIGTARGKHSHFLNRVSRCDLPHHKMINLTYVEWNCLQGLVIGSVRRGREVSTPISFKHYLVLPTGPILTKFSPKVANLFLLYHLLGRS